MSESAPAAPAPRFVAALVRHGDYEQPERVPSASLAHPLTERGREQASALASALRSEASERSLMIDRTLDCSPLLRAWQTAHLCAEQLADHEGSGFEVASYADLVERSVGAAANLTVDTIAEIVARDPRLAPLPPNWKAHPRFRLPFPGAESLLQAGARVAAHLEQRAHAHQARERDDRLVIVVSHGGAVRHAAVALGVLELERVPTLSMHHCGYVLVERLADGRWLQIGGAWKTRPNGQASD